MILAIKTGGSDYASIGQLLGVILLFLFVLALAYLAARLTGTFQSNIINKKSNIRVIEIYRVSNNKVIEIVKIGEKYFALGVGKDEINLISEIPSDEIKDNPASLEPLNFKEILEKVKREKNDNEK